MLKPRTGTQISYRRVQICRFFLSVAALRIHIRFWQGQLSALFTYGADMNIERSVADLFMPSSEFWGFYAHFATTKHSGGR